MTEKEAVELLISCKPLAARLVTVVRVGNDPLVYKLSNDDLSLLKAYGHVRVDRIVAGPGVFKKLTSTAGLDQVEVTKLEQVWRLAEKKNYHL
jgi:hypothetical protein